jgi:4-amino-4-deoxy-L-arabinose transferase-like glycosyltransferase
MKKRFLIIIGALALAALVIRFGASSELSALNNGLNSVTVPSPATDMCTYRALAGEIAHGTYKGVFYYQPFYYAVFLPVLRIAFGESVWAVIIAQCFLGALTVYLTGLCGALIWNRKAGIIAAALTVFSGVLILYTPFHLIATLQAFWIVLLLYLSLRALKSGNLFYWGLCGLVAGCGILTRGNIWFMVPGIAVAAFLSVSRHAKPETKNSKNILLSFAAVAVFVILLLLPQIPFAWHNTRIQGKLTGPSTAAGAVLGLGNTPEAPPGGRNPGLPPGPMEYPPTHQSWMKSADEISVPMQIWKWFNHEPAAFMELTMRKMLLFWDFREIPNNISMAYQGEMSSVVKYAGFVGTGYLIAGALAAIFVLLWRSLRKRDLKILLLIYCVAAYWLATSAFYILSRFRAPVIPLLAILASIFIVRTLECRKKAPVKTYLASGAALLAGFFICFTAYDYYRTNWEAAFMRVARPDGVKVMLEPGKQMLLDNGPFTFGGWQPFELSVDTVIEKDFAIKNVAKMRKAELELTLGFKDVGYALFSINGERKRFTAKRPGSITERFEIPVPENGKVEIKLLESNVETFGFIDHQRDYSRTYINGDKAPGELVCRLFISFPHKENSGTYPLLFDESIAFN